MARTRNRIVETEYPYFATCTVVGWLPVFTRPDCVAVLFDSWRYLQRNDDLQLIGYVVMENHLHVIAHAPNLASALGRFKSFMARRIIDRVRDRGDDLLLDQLHWLKDRHKVDREHQLWQEGSHPKQCRTESILRQKLEYVHDNPVRRGYVADPTHWMYSSARNYAGLSAYIEVDRDW